MPDQQPKKRDHLLKYDDESSSVYKEFQYGPLKNMRNRIRLLKLRPGRLDSDAEVACELFEAEFQEGKGGELIGVEPNGTKETFTYEALTWCWGTSPSDSLIFIEQKDNTRRKMAVSSELAWALKYLRRPATSRILWIDAICINQNSTDEKNHQVQMMAKIYSYAERVCVWLGLDDANSRKAITFVKDEILQLQRFDELCDDEKNAQKWQALLLLMQRPWFFRRWVVQEISLAKDAIIHCGPDQIPWNDFCVAVELFVEVETATHRLSEVIKKDPKFYHLPGWFDYVSALGASLLVQATTMIFRQYQPESLKKRQEKVLRRQATNFPDYPMLNRSASQLHDTDSDESVSAQSDDDIYASDENDASGKNTRPLPRQNTALAAVPRARSPSPMSSRSALLSLEYLVSKLSIFETTEPRDAIYAFLAIAKDTIPEALARTSPSKSEASLEEQKLAAISFFPGNQQKLFSVDYDRPYAEVCQNFMEFCITNSTSPGARARALDILCRPWAPGPSQGISKQKNRRMALHPAITRQKYENVLADMGDLSLLPDKRHKDPVPRDRDGPHPGALHQFVDKYQGPLRKMAKKKEDLVFPSWIPRLEGAPFVMSATPGTSIKKMLRQNADPLVGLPGDQRTYDAGEGMPVDLDVLKFHRLYLQGAHCMHVRGFQLDTVTTTSPTSQGGQIPKQWLKLARWTNAGDAQKDDGPPDEFWRTLVADRGANTRNPPSYYARACKESAVKGGLAGGTISTSDLIYNEQNSIVVQFCRRVQEVIWNKRLVVTQDGYLGLTGEKVREGDLVCILYGASVPVILRRKRKTKDQMEMEKDEVALFQKLDMMKNLVRKAAIRRRQKRKWAALPDVRKREVRKELARWNEDNRKKGETSESIQVRESNVPGRPVARAKSVPGKFGGRSPSRADTGDGKSRDKSPAQGASPIQSTSGVDLSAKKVSEKEIPISQHYYKFLGECYIHGMMDGEAVRWRNERGGRRKKEDDPVFELR